MVSQYFIIILDLEPSSCSRDCKEKHKMSYLVINLVIAVEINTEPTARACSIIRLQTMPESYISELLLDFGKQLSLFSLWTLVPLRKIILSRPLFGLVDPLILIIIRLSRPMSKLSSSKG